MLAIIVIFFLFHNVTVFTSCRQDDIELEHLAVTI